MKFSFGGVVWGVVSGVAVVRAACSSNLLVDNYAKFASNTNSLGQWTSGRWLFLVFCTFSNTQNRRRYNHQLKSRRRKQKSYIHEQGRQLFLYHFQLRESNDRSVQCDYISCQRSRWCLIHARITDYEFVYSNHV